MTQPKLKLVASRPAERLFGSAEFIAIGRNPELPLHPRRFVPTVKAKGDVVI